VQRNEWPVRLATGPDATNGLEGHPADLAFGPRVDYHIRPGSCL
jgi:hypothetical protein